MIKGNSMEANSVPKNSAKISEELFGPNTKSDEYLS
jgi:hypothetical protein